MVDEMRVGWADVGIDEEAGQRERQSVFGSLLESRPDIFLVLDLNGTILHARRIPFIDSTTFVGSSTFDYLTPEFRVALQSAMAHVLETGAPAEVEDVAVAPVWGEGRLGPNADPDGTIVAFALTLGDIKGSRSIELARRPAAERYEKAIHRSPFPMLIFDPETRLVHDVNEAALAKYGFTREEFIGLDIIELRPPEEAPVLPEHLAAGLRDYVRSPARHRLRDGRIIDVEVVGQAFEVGGRQLRMVYIDDVTEQRRATAALARSEAANLALIEAIPDLILRISEDGLYLSFVPAPDIPLAAQPEDFLGRPLESVLPAGVAATARRAVTEALASARAQTFEYELTVDGIKGAYEARLVPVEGGKEVVAMVRDITERRAAEAALRESEERFRTSFENAPIGMAIVGLDGVFLQVNRSLCEMLGYPESRLVGKGLDVISHPEDLADNLDQTVRVVAGETDSSRMDMRYVHADGRLVWGRSSVAVVRDTGGTPLYVIAQVEDVTDAAAAKESLERSATELERRAAELERSNADLAQFAYAVSHDLSEPLRMISTYLNLFASRYGRRFDDEARDFIDVLTGGVDRMQVMIRDLLAYSRAGSTNEMLEKVNLSDIVGQVLADLADRIDESHAHVTVGELPVVLGEPSQLRQVLQNLLSNSLKFVEAGVAPKVHLDAELSEGLWRISVRDNGIGIEPRFQSRVFIPFRRLHTQDQYPGTGVGLSIAKRIVERHGGTIWMETPAGGGAEFSFTLPVNGDPEGASIG